MSDLEILKQVIDALDRIQVPTEYLESIAAPIYQNNRMLKILYQAILDATKKIEAEETPETKEDTPNETAEQSV